MEVAQEKFDVLTNDFGSRDKILIQPDCYPVDSDERLLALSRDKGTSSYLLYLVDSFGYLGYVALLLGKNFWGTGLNSDPQAIMAIFNSSLIWSSFCGILLLGMAWGVFAHQFPKTPFRSTN